MKQSWLPMGLGNAEADEAESYSVLNVTLAIKIHEIWGMSTIVVADKITIPRPLKLFAERELDQA